MTISLSLGSQVSIYAVDDVRQALDKTTEGQSGEGLRRVYQKMLDTGPERFVCKPSSSAVLDPVLAACPNFGGVLEDLANYIELSVVGRRGMSFLPILLAGDPGVGKTHFTKCLAKALEVPCQFVSMGGMSAGWVLSGSAPTWAGARCGKIAESLINGNFANPVYLLDELDKTGGDSRYDPFSTLLQLMEQETAGHFKDEYLDVEMDASAIVWVATANDISRIPDYILSRLAVYEVPAPTEAQAVVIAANIYQQLAGDHDWPLERTLRADTLEAMVRVPPREMRKKLLDGMARAIRQKRTQLMVEDIRSTHARTVRSMGFTAGR